MQFSEISQDLVNAVKQIIVESDDTKLIELNVGLYINDRANTPDEVRANESVARNLCNKFAEGSAQFRTQTSDTEPTLVVKMRSNNPAGLCNELARALDQDCIALYYPLEDRGELIGPRADKWGSFSKEYFIRF